MRAQFDDRHFDVWREHICDGLLRIDTRRPTGARFDLDVDVTLLDGPLLLHADNRAPGLEFILSKQRIARGAIEDAMGLTVVLSGRAEVSRGGCSADLKRGDVCLLESREPFHKICSDDYSEQFIYLPRPIADKLVGQPFSLDERLVAPHEGTGQVLADTLLSMARHRGALQPPELRALVAGVVPVAAAVFKRNVVRETRPALRGLMRARVDAFISAHLHEPDLSPRTIATRLGCSTRYLHLVFEESGDSLGATVLARRLERCREQLTDPGERHRSISEIAFAAGFNDAAHFSRTFKARFGTSPRDWRESVRGAGLQAREIRR